ncbi:DotA/TraY family protein [Cysteiniphilum marinum]|uniref:DotA/TraY family protein n=1 Tax=Cysteiniphilum marinum TaxID=2774191 RepID=UPI00193BD76E|nr:DotA/TraY family protein [Cysteiniphilum marinum]
MRFIGIFKYPLVVITLLLTSAIARADDVFNPSDLSHNWGFVYRLLHLIFGDFIGVYGGTTENNAGVDYTVLANMGYWACWAGVILGAILLFSGVVNVYQWAKQGKEIGADVTLFAKVLIVGILIIPIAKGGISVSQRVGVIKTALWGDSFANIAYSNTVTQMLTPPKLNTTNINATRIANQIFRSQVCAWAVNDHSKTNNIDLDKVFNGTAITPTPSSEYVVSVLNDFGGSRWTSKDMKINNAMTDIELQTIKTIMYAPEFTFLRASYTLKTNVCGSIEFPDSTKGSSVFDQVAQNQSLYLKEAIINLSNKMIPASQGLYALSKKGYKLTTNGSTKVQSDYAKVINAYNDAVYSYIKEVESIPDNIQENVLDNSGLRQFIDDAGWGLAVIWWKLLADTQSSFVQNAENFGNSATTKIMPMCEEGFFAKLFGSRYCVDKSTYDVLFTNVEEVSRYVSAEIASNPNINVNLDPQAKFDQICNVSGCSFESINGWLSYLIREGIALASKSGLYSDALSQNSFEQITDFKNQESIFNTASTLGSRLSFVVSFLYGSSIGTSVLAGGLEGFTKSVAGFFGVGVASEAGANLLSWISNLLWIAATVLAVPTYTLLVILPFIPIIIWSMLLISYFIMIIEAFIAIPSGMAMWLVRDEGFITGRVIRTVMMVTALFLRPFLFVVGLAAAYALSKIALTVWNTMFFWGSAYMTSGNFITSLFLLFIYVAGLVKFTIMCYNVSFILPDKVLQWLGSGFGDVSAFGSSADFADGKGAMSMPSVQGRHGAKTLSDIGSSYGDKGGSKLGDKYKDAKTPTDPTSQGGMPTKGSGADMSAANADSGYDGDAIVGLGLNEKMGVAQQEPSETGGEGYSLKGSSSSGAPESSASSSVQGKVHGSSGLGGAFGGGQSQSGSDQTGTSPDNAQDGNQGTSGLNNSFGNSSSKPQSKGFPFARNMDERPPDPDKFDDDGMRRE